MLSRRAVTWNLSLCQTQIFLFMEVTRSGVTGGLLVANHAGGELGIAIVHAPILRHQTKEEAAWDRIRKIGKYVTSVAVQVKFPA